MIRGKYENTAEGVPQGGPRSLFVEEKPDENNYLKQRIETEVFLEILNAIEQLPGHRKETFKLSYMDGLKISEVAERLQVAEETIRSQRMKVKKQLQVI